jgi:hypothetical protein
VNHRRIVNGVTVDDTELYKQIDFHKRESNHWKQMYIGLSRDYMKQYKELKSYKEKAINKTKICCKCNGIMKHIDDFGFYVCLNCGNSEVKE